MSYRILSLVTLGYDGPDEAFRILSVLAEFANDAGTCHPSVGTVARIARRSTRRARSSLSTLEREGWVRLCGTRKGGRAKAATWQINLAKLRATGLDKSRKLPTNPDADVRVSPDENPDADGTKPGRAALETRTSTVVNPDAGVRRSSQEAIKKQSKKRERRAEPERGRQPAAATPEINHKAETTTPPDDPGDPREDDPMDDQDDGRIPPPDHFFRQVAAYAKRAAMPTTTRTARTRVHTDDDDPSQAASVQPSKAQARKEAASRERQLEAVARLTAKRDERDE